MTDNQRADSPLAGVKVIELGSYLAGPFCGTQLADLGADVVKIEDPRSGDQLRNYGPFLGGESSTFMRVNRNKRSCALDIKSPEGAALFRELVKGADVLVENMRPGTMARLGLGYEDLRRDNERLIYVAASGWGQDGPLASYAGLDIMAQARSGLMSVTGEPEGGPVKIGVPVCDIVCGIYAALGVVSALRARDATGKGQMIDVSLFETGVSFSLWESGRYFATGELPQRNGSAHQSSAPYQAFRSASGWFTLGAPNARVWRSLCGALERPDLMEDERFSDENNRFRHRKLLAAEIEKTTVTRDTDHWIAALQKAGVPCAPIQTHDQVFADPALHAREFFWDSTHPTAGTVRQFGSPIRFSASRTRRDRAGPMLGEHTGEVLAQLGQSEADRLRLHDAGTIRIAQVAAPASGA